jgi:hypothetical protein
VTRRWPLRSVLTVILVALVASGLSLTHLHRASGARPSTTLVTTSTGSVTTSSPTTTTTSPPGPIGLAAGSVVGPLAALAARAGCGFHELDATTSSTTSSTSTTSTTSSTNVAAHVSLSPLGHCRVLEIGDSIGSELGWALQREVGNVAGLNLVTKGRSSTGLSATWFYNWPQHLAAQVKEYRPNLVVICLGANDQQGLAVKGGALAFATQAWRDEYVARVTQMLDIARRAGAYVLWVGLPVMRPVGYNQGVSLLNSLYAKSVATAPGAVFLSTSALLATPAGHYRASARVGSSVQVLRATDGIHFSVIGEDIFATAVVKALSAAFHVPLPLSHPMGISG